MRKKGRPTRRKQASGRKVKSSARTSAVPNCLIRATIPRRKLQAPRGPARSSTTATRGWTCCRGKTAMDWDDFQKLPTCAIGSTPPHHPARRSLSEPRSLCASTYEVDRELQPERGQGGADGREILRRRDGTRGIRLQGLRRCELGPGGQNNENAKAAVPCPGRTGSAPNGTPVFHETLKWWGCCPNSLTTAPANTASDASSFARRGRAGVTGSSAQDFDDLAVPNSRPDYVLGASKAPRSCRRDRVMSERVLILG